MKFLASVAFLPEILQLIQNHSFEKGAKQFTDRLTRIVSLPWKTDFTVSISFSLSARDDTSQTEPVDRKSVV